MARKRTDKSLQTALVNNMMVASNSQNGANEIVYKEYTTTLANLKTSTNLFYPTVILTDIGKEGLFKYDSTDVTSVNDDMYIIVDSSNKRWKRTSDIVNTKLQYVLTIAGLQAYTQSTLCEFDGSIWEKKSGGTASNGGSYAGTIINVSTSFYWQRKCDYITPQMFGAVGDGINDDIIPINNAFLYLKNTTECRNIVFTKGNYKVSSTVNIVGNYNQGFVVEGNKSKFTATFNGIVVNIGSLVDPSPEYRKNVTIRSLTIYGNNVTNILNTALKIDEQSDVTVEDCILINAYKGLWLNGGLILNFVNLTIRENEYGIYANTTVSFSANLIGFNFCKIIKNHKALYWEGGSGSLFTTCEFEANNYTGTIGDGVIQLDFIDAGNHTFINSWFEDDKGSTGIKYRARSGYSNLVLINCEIIEQCTNILDVDGNVLGDGNVNIVGGRITQNLCTNEVLIGSKLGSIVSSNCNTIFKGNTTKLNNINFGINQIGGNYSIGSYNTLSPLNNNITAGKGDALFHYFESLAGARLGYIGMTTGGAYVSTDGVVLPIIFQTNNTERVRINSSGYMGVGVNNPAGIFDVSSTTSPSYSAPRMTTTQINTLSAMSMGAWVFDITTGHPKYYNGSVWVQI